MLTSGRDIALVNKQADFLKDHLLVPPNLEKYKIKSKLGLLCDDTHNSRSTRPNLWSYDGSSHESEQVHTAKNLVDLVESQDLNSHKLIN